jgi:hypothetical protein
MSTRMTILSVLTILSATQARADDCDRIRTAIAKLPASGGEVVVAAGIYECSSPIIIDRSDVTLRGEKQDQVTIRLQDQKHAPLLIVGALRTVIDSSGSYVAEHRVHNIHVSNLSFDGNRAHHDPSKECGEGSCDGDPSAVRNNGITLRGASNVTIENVTTHSMISGGMVTEKFCDHLVVHDFTSYDNYFDGFAGYETSQSVFYNLLLRNNRGAGISIDINFNNNTIRDSELRENGDVGIFARNLKENTFQNVKILDSHKYGVFLAYADGLNSCARDNTFDQVTVNGSALAGIRLNNNCVGNKVINGSNLCGNNGGAASDASEHHALLIDESVACRPSANEP